MKKFFPLIIVIILCQLSNITAQVPQSMNYQAVARNAGGNIIANQNIGVRFTIRDGGISGAIVYRETNTATTNQFGLFTAAIGAGTAVNGTFTGINWATGTKFLQIEVDLAGGSNYTDMG